MSAMDKKIKILIEALPRLDESEARRLLERAGGSVNKASDMALEDGEWSAAPAKKKPVKKDEKKDKKETTAAAPRRSEKVDRPRREFVKAEPKVEKKQEIKATPSTIVVGASKAKVEAGLSFADMIKRQKQPEPVVEAVPEPTPAPVAAPVEEEVTVVVTPAVAAEIVEEPAVEVVPVVVEVAAPKPKKERKEPKKKAPAPLPQKYEAEIDRVDAVSLPANIVELATNAFTFSSEPGRAPSPPRQVVQPVHPAVHHQPDWNNNARQHQPTVQRSWNQDAGYNRNQHFTNDWRQNNRGYNNDGMGGYNTQRMNYRQDNTGYHNSAMRPQPQPSAQSFW